MKYANKLALSIAVVLSSPYTVSAAGPVLTQACEEALALSALPVRLRDRASVYSLTDGGFKLTRQSDGPFTCIVARNHETAVIPQCADAAGAESVIPGIISKTEWALSGMPPNERKARFEELAEKGEFRAPHRPGINYMMSAFNLVWNDQNESMMHIPPHVMYYAPNISNDDVGGSFSEAMGGNRGTPYIVEAGIHGYMTSLVDKASDSSDVMASCKGQISLDGAKSIGGS